MTPSVSIVIPLYNKEDVISQTLESVNWQTFKDWECVIVDDGSTDKSLEVVEAFVNDHPGNWLIVKQRNQGQAIARNTGINSAAGEFLAFLDADDIWPPDKLSTQVQALKGNSNAVCVLSSYAIFGKNRLRIVRHASSQTLLTRWLDMSGFGGGLESVGLVRKTALQEIGSFDTTFSTSSGLDVTLRLSQVGEVLVLKSIGLYYRLAEGQWHTDLQELSRNLSLLQARYSSIYKGDLGSSHAAYIFWALARPEGAFYLIREFGKSLFHLKNGRARMFILLIQRNLKSVVLGQIQGQPVLKMLARLESKVPNPAG